MNSLQFFDTAVALSRQADVSAPPAPDTGQPIDPPVRGRISRAKLEEWRRDEDLLAFAAAGMAALMPAGLAATEAFFVRVMVP